MTFDNSRTTLYMRACSRPMQPLIQKPSKFVCFVNKLNNVTIDMIDRTSFEALDLTTSGSRVVKPIIIS